MHINIFVILVMIVNEYKVPLQAVSFMLLFLVTLPLIITVLDTAVSWNKMVSEL